MTVTTTSTSAQLSWQPPSSDGGRDDLFYVIKYKSTQQQNFSYYSPSPPITTTTITISSLTPMTTYMFMVVAENGLTQEFPNEFPEDDRTSSAIYDTIIEGDKCTCK